MAIIKRGDNMPVLSYLDDEGKEVVCSECGCKLVVVAIDDQNNKLICEACDEGE